MKTGQTNKALISVDTKTFDVAQKETLASCYHQVLFNLMISTTVQQIDYLLCDVLSNLIGYFFYGQNIRVPNFLETRGVFV